MKAKRIVPIFIAAAITLIAATATVNAITTRAIKAENASQLRDAAFRDGLFQGKLAVQRGAARNPITSRWNVAADRDAFAVGYERGFDEPVIELQ